MAVVVEKAGDVIPAVVEVVLNQRPPTAKPFDFAGIVSKIQELTTEKE